MCLRSRRRGVASAAVPQAGNVVFWGCKPVDPGVSVENHGQCTVPARARSGVIALAPAFAHNLALRKDGSVVAWGCLRDREPVIQA